MSKRLRTKTRLIEAIHDEMKIPTSLTYLGRNLYVRISPRTTDRTHEKGKEERGDLIQSDPVD